MDMPVHRAITLSDETWDALDSLGALLSCQLYGPKGVIEPLNKIRNALTTDTPPAIRQAVSDAGHVLGNVPPILASKAAQERPALLLDSLKPYLDMREEAITGLQAQIMTTDLLPHTYSRQDLSARLGEVHQTLDELAALVAAQRALHGGVPVRSGWQDSRFADRDQGTLNKN